MRRAIIASDTTADVELRLPTDGAFISVLRTATAGLAARLDFTLDDLEDVRMAVGEAAALVLEAADPGADLTTRFWLRPHELTITVATPARAATAPAADSFAWTVLTTLAREATVRAEPGIFEITLLAGSSIGRTEPHLGAGR
ncbi:anti-sigma factor [Nocardioides sp. CER19]|uniref:anti-sigma factor n=1 Tax=Nocardioides sp. CER19 TaxID=3038538 RepID=UPI0024476DA9|nr:anti-sigma factor [Nocardioides sp. CER19]MDH2415343.1 anti-sigma factor [Nocardioides sp. CER19]